MRDSFEYFYLFIFNLFFMRNRARMDIRHCFVPNLPGIVEIEEKQEEKQEGRERGEIEEKQEGREGGGGGGERGGERGGGGEGGGDREGEKEGGGEGEDNMKSKEDSECESTKRVVIMAKHLCGVATDLALRSLESFKKQNTNTNGKFYLFSL